MVSPGSSTEAATPATGWPSSPRPWPARCGIEGPTTTASGSTPPPASAGVPPAGDHRPVGRRPPADALSGWPLHDGVQRRDLQPRRAAPRPGAGCQVAGPLRHRGAAGGHGRGAWRARWAEPTGCSRWRSSMPAPARCASPGSHRREALYYGWAGDTLVFGSELKALRFHPHLPGTIDRGRWRRSSATRSCRPPHDLPGRAQACRARP